MKKIFVFLSIATMIVVLGTFCSCGSGKGSHNATTGSTDDDNVAATLNRHDKEKQTKKAFLESIYKDLLNIDNYNDEKLENALTEKIKIKLKKWAEEDGMADGLATWVFTKDHYYSPVSNNTALTVTQQDENHLLVEVLYHYSEGDDGKQKVLLTVIEDGDTYKIDDLVVKESVFGAEGEAYEYEEEYSDSEYSRYFAKWSNYIVSQGKRVRVYTATIFNDMTAEWTLFMADGSVNTTMSFGQCVFKDGYVYFTDNGDITIKGTPRFRLGPDGLQTPDGEDLVKE